MTLSWRPPGAGKSVLLAQWAATLPDLVVHLAGPEPADDDPVRFAQRRLGGIADVDAELAELGELVSLHTGGLGDPPPRGARL